MADVEKTLAENLPEVEVVDVEIAGGGGNRILRVFIDHPDGVDHDLCMQVTGLLGRYLKDHTVEVSSPGLERRLRRPGHFQAAVGEKLNVRTFGPVEGQRNFTGFLVSAGSDSLVLNQDGREVSIPYREIARARTVFEFGKQSLLKGGKDKKKKSCQKRC
jgi:ribosome maturation factor RimP